MSIVSWKSLPLCIPFPPGNIVTKISDSDWRICIDSWIFLLNGYLAAPLQELEEVSKQYGSLVDFLRAALRWTASNPASSRSLHDPELRRLVFLNVHHLLLDSASPSSLLLDWTFLGDFRRVFHGSGACTNTLLSAYDQHSETIEEQLHQIKSQLTTTFESAKAASLLDFANNHDDSLLPLMKAIPGIGTYFVTGSDLLDAAVSVYPKAGEAQKRIVLFVYIGLVSLTEGTKPNASLLFDHLYSLKAPLSTTTSAPPPGQSLISDLITDTPLLSIITRRLSGVQATRANTIISTLEPLRRAHSSRPHRKPTIAQKGKATALSAASEHPVHAHRLSLITQIQDLFPDLGSAFVLALLDHFTDDVEAVTAALLDDSLPPNLQSLDRASNLPSPSFSESTQHVPPPHSPIIAPTHQPRLRPTNAQPALETTSGSFPTERRNKYDNDAFDSLAVSTSQLHLGKRNQRNTADTLLSSGTSSNAKAAILAALSAFDADDDERDDTYDAEDVGGTVDTPGAAPGGDLTDDREEPLYRAWSAPGGPQLFARDGAVRRSAQRRRLREESGMTDEGVEGWALMLGREPGRVRRLERLFGEKMRNVAQTEVQSTRWQAQDDDEEEDGGVASRGGAPRGRGRGRGRGGGGRGGNVAGPADDKATQVARQRKDASKGSRANHNRRDQRAKKMARGGFPG